MVVVWLLCDCCVFFVCLSCGCRMIVKVQNNMDIMLHMAGASPMSAGISSRELNLRDNTLVLAH